MSAGFYVCSMHFNWSWNTNLLQVANYTYTCYFPGQELSVRIISNGWLHKGALMCPPCEELCKVKKGKQVEMLNLQSFQFQFKKLNVFVSIFRKKKKSYKWLSFWIQMELVQHVQNISNYLYVNFHWVWLICDTVKYFQFWTLKIWVLSLSPSFGRGMHQAYDMTIMCVFFKMKAVFWGYLLLF
jgi:hypothetical protein